MLTDWLNNWLNNLLGRSAGDFTCNQSSSLFKWSSLDRFFISTLEFDSCAALLRKNSQALKQNLQSRYPTASSKIKRAHTTKGANLLSARQIVTTKVSRRKMNAHRNASLAFAALTIVSLKLLEFWTAKPRDSESRTRICNANWTMRHKWQNRSM